MLSKVTHGTSSDSIILVATVVLPDALPPHMPATNKDYRLCLLTLCSLRICSSYLTVNMPGLVSFLLGNSPASEVYMPTFRTTLFHLHRQVAVCRIYTHLPA